MIDKKLVDEVLSRTSIEAVISPYVTLKRAGSTMKGLCPFHSERTPSFVVYPGDNSFYCFGCGAGGDAITFLKKAENMNFEDAVEVLAKRAGIPFVRSDADAKAPRFDRNRILELNREAARYFHARLFDKTPAAAAARAYLTEKRGLSLACVNHFGLGFAPYDPRGFVSHFTNLGYKPDELIAAFLCGKSEANGALYQSFRDRVMFPIIDVAGNVIAFGGRVLDSSPQKYKNSSDTPVFKKSKNLYALNFARQTCAERLILCEGYMDVIAMHAAGFTNAVATLGTAITPEQARLLSHYTKRVILSYDSDEAGQKATARAISLLEPVGLSVSVLHINGAKDPDEYIRKFGADSFRALLDKSLSKFEFNLDKVLSRHNIGVPQEKIAAAAELCRVISGVYSSAERGIYVSEVAKRLGIDPAGIRADVEREIRKRNKKDKQESFRTIRQNIAGYGDRINPDRARDPQLAGLENTVLSLLLLYPAHRDAAMRPDIALTEEDFFTAFGKRIFAFVRDHFTPEGPDAAALNEQFTDEEIGRMTEIRISRMDFIDNGDAVFRESVTALREAMQNKRLFEQSTTLAGLDALVKAMRDREGNKQNDEG